MSIFIVRFRSPTVSLSEKTINSTTVERYDSEELIILELKRKQTIRLCWILNNEFDGEMLIYLVLLQLLILHTHTQTHIVYKTIFQWNVGIEDETIIVILMQSSGYAEIQCDAEYS